LSGGKNDRTCITVIDYYPQHHKIFLKEIKDKMPLSDESSQDQYILDILKDRDLKLIAIDSPLQMPPCLQHECKSLAACKSHATQWMWKQYRRIKKKKKNLKLFTPYTERPIERFINYDLEEFFEMPEAFGANKAPLAARSIYLKPKIKGKLIEVFPRLSVSRMGQKMKISKTDIKNYRHSIYGMDCREDFLKNLVERDFLFIYDQDFHKLVENPHAFDSMICALTAYLSHQHQCEKPPKHFPVDSGWVEFPDKNFEF
jgi:hypothetical protein